MSFVRRGSNLEIICDPQEAMKSSGYRRQLLAAARLADALGLRFIPDEPDRRGLDGARKAEESA